MPWTLTIVLLLSPLEPQMPLTVVFIEDTFIFSNRFACEAFMDMIRPPEGWTISYARCEPRTAV